VNFETHQDAVSALKLNNTKLDGSTIQVALQHQQSTKKISSTIKIMGLPASVTNSDILKAVEPFGIIRSINFIHADGFQNLTGAVIRYALSSSSEKAQQALNNSTTAFPGSNIKSTFMSYKSPRTSFKSSRGESSPRGRRSSRGSRGHSSN